MTSASNTMDWLKRIQTALIDLEQKPQFGTPWKFPLEKLQAALRDVFKIPALKISLQDKGWVEPPELFLGLGEKVHGYSIVFSPLSVACYFALTEQDLQGAVIELLDGEEAAAPFLEREVYEGFSHYLALEVLSVIDRLDYAKNLVPRLENINVDLQAALSQTPCYLMDVLVEFKSHKLHGRIFLPTAFRTLWKQYFLQFPEEALYAEVSKKIPVEVALEVGQTHLSLNQWKGVHEGDFILLDQCSFDPTTQKGRFLLTLSGHPLFRGKIVKEGGIKILEYPLYEEMSKPMDKTYDDEDDSLYSDFDDDDDLFDDEDDDFAEEEDAGESKEPLFDEDSLLDKEDAAEEDELEEMSSPQKINIAPEKIPVVLTVEMGHIRMTAEELMNLAPGNLLDLHVLPEQGVDLMINGKKVGRGELLKLGETLGVRILEL